jgi:hypothetical protein
MERKRGRVREREREREAETERQRDRETERQRDREREKVREREREMEREATWWYRSSVSRHCAISNPGSHCVTDTSEVARSVKRRTWAKTQ